MKKTLLSFVSAAAVCALAYAAGTGAKSLPRTVQGIDYASTMKADGQAKATGILPASDYPSDPGDLGVPDGEFTFDMIETWAGEGENRAALVIQFNDEREKNALVFGYRWDGQATGVDMIKAVVEANPRLYALLEYTNVSSPTDPNGGYVVGGLGWDADEDGDIRLSNGSQTFTTETGFVEHPDGYKPGQGGSSAYDYDDWSSLDPDDFWGSGWYVNGYWSYWLKEDEASSFGYSSIGASGRVLKNNSWDGWNFAADFMSADWKEFVAAPKAIPDGAKTLFKNNGIYYSLKSYSAKTVSVCAPFETEGETLSSDTSEGETLGSYTGDITIPATFTDEDITYKVIAIADAAFAGSEVSTVTLPETVTEIGADAFSATPLSALKFAGEGNIDQIKKMGERAFCATAITTPLFSKQISTLPAAVFSGTAISEVIIPDWVTEIGEMCFAANEALTDIVIPGSVKTLGSGAFTECPALRNIKVETTVAPSGTEDCFDASTYENATLIVPVGYTETYDQAEGWKNFKNTDEFVMEVHVGDLFDMNGASFRVTATGDKKEVVLTYKRVEGPVNRESIMAANKAGYTGTLTVAPTVQYQTLTFNVTAMNDSTFYGASELTGVVLPEGLTAIPDHAFDKCTTLASVSIPSTVETIGKFAFANIDALKSIVLPEGLKSLGERTFSYSSGLQTINLPKSLTSLPNHMFYDAESLESIEIPESITTLGKNLFDNCTSLKSVKLPSSITAIPDYIFYNCSSLTEISIPAAVTSIGNYAFANCDVLAAINIPAAVTSIGNSAFLSCAGLSAIEIPAGVSEIGSSAFKGCSGITEIRIPEAVKTINGSLFQNCAGLKKVTMSPDVNLKSSNIFRDCAVLETIAYYGEEESAQPGVFKVPANTGTLPGYIISGCTLIKKIILPQGLKTIDSNALNESSITEIDIPESVTKIQQYALANTSISEIVIPASVTSLGTYLAQKNTNATFYMCNPEPISISGTTFSSGGYSGPYLPVVVPTGTVEAYQTKDSDWKKSEIKAPSISTIATSIADVTFDGSKHIVSGKIDLTYDIPNLPAKFVAANNTYVFSNMTVAYEIAESSRSNISGEVFTMPDGTFAIELENLEPASTYEMNVTAKHGGNNYWTGLVSFDTPVTTGIGSITVPEDAVGDFYSVSGVLMASAITADDARTTLPAGLYIFRAGSKTYKIIIR